MRRLLPPVGFLLATLAVAAQPPDRSARPPWGTPVAELPGIVKAADGQLTVFADFEVLDKDGLVPIFIVNRTAAAVPIEHQDGNPYLMLEHEVAPGKWVRAQSHKYSFCGLSYGVETLEPGRFVVTTGYRPARGEEVAVRYKFYGQKHTAVASNVGRAPVDKAEVEQAAGDAMAVQTGSFDFVRKVVLGEIKLPMVRRESALLRLVNDDFDPREVNRVLTAVARDPDMKLADWAALLLMLREPRPPKE